MKSVVLAVIALCLGAACGKKTEPGAGSADPWAQPAGTPTTAAGAQPAATPPSVAAPTPIDGPFLGKWSGGGASFDMLDPGTPAGSESHQYKIYADGTYTYHREAYSMARSGQYFVVDERGTVSVAGDQITITAIAHDAASKTKEGEIVQPSTLPLERVTYRWQMHFFEGLGENQLVLTPIDPAAQTTRDGTFASNGLFPQSYLLSSQTIHEWTFPPS
jgi:hypothetical protein